jgi:hypothetical protein
MNALRLSSSMLLHEPRDSLFLKRDPYYDQDLRPLTCFSTSLNNDRLVFAFRALTKKHFEIVLHQSSTTNAMSSLSPNMTVIGQPPAMGSFPNNPPLPYPLLQAPNRTPIKDLETCSTWYVFQTDLILSYSQPAHDYLPSLSKLSLLSNCCSSVEQDSGLPGLCLKAQCYGSPLVILRRWIHHLRNLSLTRVIVCK